MAGDDPWIKLNAYAIHPTVEWKDLSVKFVQGVYRDYVYTKDETFLNHMYPAVKVCVCLPMAKTATLFNMFNTVQKLHIFVTRYDRCKRTSTGSHPF